MDWSKAKSILIVAFIVTNLLLGYVLFINEKQIDATIKEDFINDATRLLNNKNIVVGTEIPRINPSLYGLTVEYELMDSTSLNRNFFLNEGNIIRKGEGLIEIESGNEHLTIINKKLLIYESENIEEKYNISNEEEAVTLAMEFLQENKYDISDMKLSYAKFDKGTFYLEFSKMYGDIYLESAFTNIRVDNTGIKKLERTWLNVKEVGETPIYISSAPKSILGLLSMEEVYGKVIKDISLCYYFEPEKHDYVQKPKEAKQGNAIPAWRVQFEDGYKVFLDNY